MSITELILEDLCIRMYAQKAIAVTKELTKGVWTIEKTNNLFPLIKRTRPIIKLLEDRIEYFKSIAKSRWIAVEVKVLSFINSVRKGDYDKHIPDNNGTEVTD